MTKYHTKTTRKELARTQKIMNNLINREKEDYDKHPLPKQPSHLLVIPKSEMQCLSIIPVKRRCISSTVIQPFNSEDIITLNCVDCLVAVAVFIVIKKLLRCKSTTFFSHTQIFLYFRVVFINISMFTCLLKQHNLYFSTLLPCRVQWLVGYSICFAISFRYT